MLWRVRNRNLHIGKRPLLMGVLNVTPDSFSDGGRWLETDKAVEQGARLLSLGADIIDVGGESTRPGATSISVEEELRRVIPVIKALKNETTACISVDTYKPEVARAAVDAGAEIINDIGGLRDPLMRQVVKQSRAGAIAMHMRGNPATMQVSPHYQDVVAEVQTFLLGTLSLCAEDGIDTESVALDPGFGFGKTLEHNLELLRTTHSLQRLGRPIVLGVSRKSFLHVTTGEREWATVALSSFATGRGHSILRVHAVEPNLEAVVMTQLIQEAC